MSKLIFVYGTLRKESATDMYRLLARSADFVGDGYFQGILYKVDYYPGVVPSKNNQDKVLGEVYEIKSDWDSVIEKLDDYEECGPKFPSPTEYIRELCPIEMIDTKTVNAWVYIYNRSVKGLERIESGDFLRNSSKPR